MPVGVVGLITPWNFPMAIPSLEALPRAGGRQHLRDQAGDRYAALRLQPGAGARRRGPAAGRGQYRQRRRRVGAGNALVEHPDVRAISFTGSSEVGSHVRSAPRPLSSRFRSRWAARTPRSCSTTPTLNWRSMARSGARSGPPASAAPPPAASCCRRASPRSSPTKLVAAR